MRSYRLLLALAVGLGASSCQQQTNQRVGAALPPAQAAEVRRKIVSWLECDECSEGQRDSVVALGAIADPTLRATLLEGPSPAKREMLRRSLSDTYSRLKSYESTHPDSRVPLSEQQYVDLYTSNYLALYAVRSATALGLIGGEAAADALRTAAKMQLRGDARAVVDSALVNASRR
jgi:hypothetical protein